MARIYRLHERSNQLRELRSNQMAPTSSMNEIVHVPVQVVGT